MPNKKKVLIIEDEKALLEAIEKKLELEGFEAITAYDGQEGLEKIRKDKPDLILLDILMPKVDGFEVLKEIKKDPDITKIPVIIISNSGQPVEIEKALDLGAVDYLIKAEFNPDEVISKINDIFNKEGGKNTDKKIGGKKILIIEDDKLLLDLCSKKLKKDGFEIDIAVDGEMGIEKIGSKPDLILLDLVLPGIDGFEILKRIKTNSDKSISEIPVIILSNLGQESDIEKGKAMGAIDYLIKASVTIDEISNKIRNILLK